MHSPNPLQSEYDRSYTRGQSSLRMPEMMPLNSRVMATIFCLVQVVAVFAIIVSQTDRQLGATR